MGRVVPTSPDVAEVAAEANPDAVVVGVDNDPVVPALDRIAKVNANSAAPLQLRPVAEIEALFEGAELLNPGVVDVHLWRPDDDSERRIDLRVVGGAARIR